MEEKALEVLERLVEDDEESVEAWYLGGWCLYLMGEKAKVVAEQSLAESDQRIDESRALGLSSRDWLSNALRLFDLIGYEDEKLREHALELVALLDGILGDKQDGDECEEWEDKEDEDRAEDYTMRKV
jgi:NAD-dependent histone deacetylase SIR2